MSQLRIFISSPSDVSSERQMAIEAVQELRPHYRDAFDLKEVFWEGMPLNNCLSFQEAIEICLNQDDGVDIAIFILWSRLGTNPGAQFKRDDGSEYRSGTERELDLMQKAWLRQCNARPHILFYVREDEEAFEENLQETSTGKKRELVYQKDLAETFISQTFNDKTTGANIHAYFKYKKPNNFKSLLKRHLTEHLNTVSSRRSGPPAWDIDSHGPPFVGLDSHSFRHADVFCGRESEIHVVHQRLKQSADRGCAFVLVSGASGIGKSSLVNAGILPVIVNDEKDGSFSGWIHESFTPADLGGDPALGIARILLKKVLRSAGVPVSGLASALRDNPKLAVSLSVTPALRGGAGDSSGKRLILAVDQLEEIATDNRFNDESRGQFAAILASLATSGRVWIIATIRSDLSPLLCKCTGMVQLKNDGLQFELIRPDVTALRRIIEIPAHLAGLTYEKIDGRSLAEKILSDVAHLPELLPSLSYLLRELFEKKTADNMLTFAAYKSLGGIEGAIAKQADASLDRLPHDVQRSLPEVLEKLVAVKDDPEGQAVRRRIAIDSFPSGSPARAIVDNLVYDRLATRAPGDDGASEVSIAHEAVLRVWPRAASWIDENRQFLEYRDRLEKRMRENAPLSASDPLLPSARMIIKTRSSALEPRLQLYVKQQIDAIDTERVRRDFIRRSVVGALSILTVAASITAVVALWQWREVNIQREQLTEQREQITKERGLAETARQEADDAKVAAEAESARVKKQLYYADLYKLGIAIDTNQRNVATEVIAAAAADYRSAYGDAGGEPIELNILRAEIDGSISVLKGHESSVRSAVFSPDGSRVVTTSDDKTARLWDATTGMPLAVCKGHEKALISVAFSSDGSRLATSSEDMTVRLWDACTGTSIAVLGGHTGSIDSILFNADGSRLATCSIDNTARLWDTTAGTLVAVLQGHDRFQRYDRCGIAVAFSPDGSRMVTNSADSSARLVDASTGKTIAFLEGHEDVVDAVAFSPDGTRAATYALDNTVRIWDAATGAVICDNMEPPLVIQKDVSSASNVAFMPGRSILAISVKHLGDIVSQLYDTASGHPLSEYIDGKIMWIRGDGFHDVFLGYGGVFWTGIQIFAINQEGQVVRTGQIDPSADPGNQGIVALSPDGRIMAAVGGGNRVLIYSVSGLGIVERRATLEGHAADITSVAFSPDGSRLVSSSIDGSVRLWDISEAAERLPVAGSGFALSPDGLRVAIAGGASVDLHDTATGELLARLKVPFDLNLAERNGLKPAFSPDGSLLALNVGLNTFLWDSMTGSAIAVPRHSQASDLHENRGYLFKSVAFSQDGSRLTIFSHAGDRLQYAINLDADGSTTVSELRGLSAGTAPGVFFSPDSSRLAVVRHSDMSSYTGQGVTLRLNLERYERESSIYERSQLVDLWGDSGANAWAANIASDGTATVWNPVTGDLLAELKGHGFPLEAVTFTCDMSRVITNADQGVGAARLWDTATGETVPIVWWDVLEWDELGSTAVAVSPTGSRMAAGLRGGKARVWDTSTGDAIATLDLGEDARLYSVDFSPDGSRLILQTYSGLWLFDSLTNKFIATVTGGGYGYEFSRDGSRLMNRTYPNLLLWNAATGALVASHESVAKSWSLFQFCPDGLQYAIMEDGNTRLIDSATGDLVATLEQAEDIRLEDLQFCPSGSCVIANHGDSTRLWDRATGRLLTTLDEGVWEDRVFSPDGSRLVVSSWDSTRLYEPSTGRALATLDGERGYVSIVFSPDGSRIAGLSADGDTRLWDAATGDKVNGCGKQLLNVRRSAWSPNGSRVVSSFESGLTLLWSGDTGAFIAVLRDGEATAEAIAFSPDGLRLAVGFSDGTGRLYEATGGKEYAVLKGHKGAVNAVGFSSDGVRVATGCEDYLRLWDGRSGEFLAAVKSALGPIVSVEWTVDGSRVATSSLSDGLKVWGLTNAETHSLRLASMRNRARVGPLVDGWLVESTSHAAVKANLAAAKSALTGEEWIEAANLVLIRLSHRDEVLRSRGAGGLF